MEIILGGRKATFQWFLSKHKISQEIAIFFRKNAKILGEQYFCEKSNVSQGNGILLRENLNDSQENTIHLWENAKFLGWMQYFCQGTQMFHKTAWYFSERMQRFSGKHNNFSKAQSFCIRMQSFSRNVYFLRECKCFVRQCKVSQGNTIRENATEIEIQIFLLSHIFPSQCPVGDSVEQ